MQKIAIAEKSQFVHAEWNGVKYEQYHVSEEEFFTFLNQYEYDLKLDAKTGSGISVKKEMPQYCCNFGGKNAGV